MQPFSARPDFAVRGTGPRSRFVRHRQHPPNSVHAHVFRTSSSREGGGSWPATRYLRQAAYGTSTRANATACRRAGVTRPNLRRVNRRTASRISSFRLEASSPSASGHRSTRSDNDLVVLYYQRGRGRRRPGVRRRGCRPVHRRESRAAVRCFALLSADHGLEALACGSTPEAF
jgi:hypothetical protein